MKDSCRNAMLFIDVFFRILLQRYCKHRDNVRQIKSFEEIQIGNEIWINKTISSSNHVVFYILLA